MKKLAVRGCELGEGMEYMFASIVGDISQYLYSANRPPRDDIGRTILCIMLYEQCIMCYVLCIMFDFFEYCTHEMRFCGLNSLKVIVFMDNFP